MLFNLVLIPIFSANHLLVNHKKLPENIFTVNFRYKDLKAMSQIFALAAFYTILNKSRRQKKWNLTSGILVKIFLRKFLSQVFWKWCLAYYSKTSHLSCTVVSHLNPAAWNLTLRPRGNIFSSKRTGIGNSKIT